ncbi:AraC family transcriptional regulator [Massilia sp. Root351]|jgi:AraC-like DNA-binding protein|uniref:AraC family transcriptional regulator n=1 Tax=Massilia sp. Root351 TaxID=1736522 RepID=UPI000709D24A|nr:helix-turn-helix domain-containing protein [Massilia sp. Root351]KQV90665.1 AraC family transcriptional regulator [Massilia sp. Root351]
MHYKEFPPHPVLRPYVACLWASASGGPAQDGRAASHRVLPDNCIDILWQDTGAPAFAVGMMTRAIHVASERVVRTVAVRFKPGAAGIFLSPPHGPALPLHHLADRRSDLDQLWGRSGADRLADSLWGRELSDTQRLALIERSLLARLREAAAGGKAAAAIPPRPARPSAGGLSAPSPAGPLVGAALDAIERSGGALRIETLADGLGVSRQHLAAQFRAKVGLTPKMYARIARFRRATGALAEAPAPDWARLALDCGYFDQSHLIHDFQEFSGSAPENFLR